MAVNPLPMEFPVPPPHSNIDEMHRWMLSVYNWIKNTMLNGVQPPFYSQNQLEQMMSLNQLSQGGKIFFNNDSGKVNVGEIHSGPTLVISQVTTTPI